MNRMICRCAAVLAAVWCCASAHAAYIEMADGSRVEGTDIRARSDGTIILTTAKGQVTYQKGQYVKAVADKPADFDRARQMVAQKQYDEALKLLESIATTYRSLEWDNNARIVMGQIYLAKGDAAKAVETYEQIVRGNPAAKKEPAVLWGLLDAMVKAQQYDKLAPQLDELVAKGSRAEAAKAQVLRGDVRMAQGQVEQAVQDYLRAGLLYESEREVVPEALFKAAEGLDKLRDPRAKELYRRVAGEYGGTPYGQKAAGK